MATDSGTSQVLTAPSRPTDSVIQISIPVSTKLDRQNFLTWRSQIETIIDGFGLSKFLSPDVFPPPQNLTIDGVTSTNSAYLPWYQQDRFLFGWLRSSISEGVLSQYVACKSARVLWLSLHQVYSAISTARIMELRRSLQTSTRGNRRCGIYFEHMRSIADQLASSGEPVPESDLVRSILSGLGQEYNSFVVVLTTRSSPVSLIELHSSLTNPFSSLRLRLPSLMKRILLPFTLLLVEGATEVEEALIQVAYIFRFTFSCHRWFRESVRHLIVGKQGVFDEHWFKFGSMFSLDRSICVEIRVKIKIINYLVNLDAYRTVQIGHRTEFDIIPTGPFCSLIVQP